MMRRGCIQNVIVKK